MDNTQSDFWQMVAENQSKCLVMLCQTQEEGQVSHTSLRQNTLTSALP